MIDSNLFNSHEKAVVVSLLIEMANVDDNVAFEELVTTNNIFARLGIDRDTFETGRALDTKYAIEAVKAISLTCRSLPTTALSSQPRCLLRPTSW